MSEPKVKDGTRSMSCGYTRSQRRARSRRNGRLHTYSGLQKNANHKESVMNVSDGGWREEEIFGMTLRTSCEISSVRVKHKARPSNASADVEDNWRWKEILGGTIADDGEEIKKEEGNQHREDPQILGGEPTIIDDDDEDGWRYDEIFASTRPTRTRVKHKKRTIALEDNWRWKEVSTGSSIETPREPRCVEALEIERTHCKSVYLDDDKLGQVQVGDIIRLVSGGQPEYRDCSAVVTKTEEKHCTATVLDDDCRFGVGQCWPGYGDVIVLSRAFRLGTRIVIDGMKKPRYNGLTGVIKQHPREGHPVFINKPSLAGKVVFTVCVVFDDPVLAGERSALLEPRFVMLFEDAALRAAQSIGEAVTLLTSKMACDKESKTH